MFRPPPRPPPDRASAASDVYKRQASARPFVTHHNALDMPLFLRIADELYLKRLLVGGFERVYEIGHDFRNEGMDRTHNPEFTMLEWYMAYADYHEVLTMFEELLSGLVQATLGGVQLERQGHTLDFTAVSYTHLTPPASDSGENLGGPVSLKKKKK